MTLFRRSESSHERTPEEREYARRLREARRQGLPDPPRPDAPEAEAEVVEPVYEPAPSEPAERTEDVVAEPHPEAVEPDSKPQPEPDPEPQPEPDLTWTEPVRETPEPDPDPDIVWTEPVRDREPEPEREPDPEPEPTAAADPEPRHDLPPTEAHDVASIWEEPPNPAQVSGVERRPPPLPARRSARPLPKPPRRRYAGAPPRSPAGPPARRRRSWAGRVFAVLLIVLAVVVLWFLFSLFQPGKGAGEGRVPVTIPNGATSRQIGDLLADKGVVSSGFFFDLRARINGKRDDLKAGTYVLAADMSYGAAFEKLGAVPQAEPTTRVTIPEGRSIREAAATVKEAGVDGNYVDAARSQPGFKPRRYGAPPSAKTLEGFLFPATYELPASKSDADRLVRDQLTAFEQNFAEVDMRAAKKANLTPYDVLIIASMVEREAQVPKERRQIAAVIYNRLKDGMTLGIDATTRYELNEWSRPLRVSELEADTPYNTRTNTGLPPTPIGSPGLASIEAAANPAKVDYLFYVVKPNTCGEHDFSSDDVEFQRDVAAYEAARAANGGKAPTKCP